MSAYRIMVVSPSWQTRALLAAQIGEATGLEVVSAPGVNEALGLIKLHGIDPALLVVDAGRQISRRDVKRLMEAESQVPLVAIVSRFRLEAFGSLLDCCAAALLRPVSIGEVTRAVARLLEGHPQSRRRPV